MPADGAARKSYVLVSSSDRRPGSQSTTDFHVRLPVPIHRVIKTDLVQAVMDYRVANVTAPANTFRMGEGESSRDLTIEEGLYTPYTLREALADLLGDPYIVIISADNVLTVEYPVPDSGMDMTAANRQLAVTNATLQSILGLRAAALTPTYSATDGEHGTFFWRIPRPVTLTNNEPYLLVQSQHLGTDIITTSGDRGFWRMLLNDPAQGVVAMVNNRVDTYLDTPRTLQEIDIRLTYPSGAIVNNRNGSLALLIEVLHLV